MKEDKKIRKLEKLCDQEPPKLIQEDRNDGATCVSSGSEGEVARKTRKKAHQRR